MLNNGIIFDKFVYNVEERQKIREKLNLNQSTKVIGNIGRFSTQKNHVFMIRLFDAFHKLVPDSKLLLVGVGELMDATKKHVEKLGLTDAVIFAGFRNDTYRFYQAFDLFLMPSLYEGLPFVGIEAQTSGLPLKISPDQILETTDKIQLSQKVNSPPFLYFEDIISSLNNNAFIVKSNINEYK